ncbi:beta-ketoacyl synthase N-terminal-like domain-containing protein [Virgibacillus dokdonensis]|uniref:beta-ketoacyl synthase N-terminal-like domain-containing protein n=1 Tax=Virgibacillus dokdonensis TaxID=302167 RepID=UPI00098A024E|nr:beta-ketoacyl synthase N-terminal-like domain-containing protein [Virgibacillus dokdonensis]
MKTLITGSSILCSAGISMEEAWSSFLNQKNTMSRRYYNLGTEYTQNFPVYPIRELDLSTWFSSKELNLIKKIPFFNDKDFQFLLVAIKQLIIESNLEVSNNNRISLVIAHENPGVNNLTDSLLKEDFYNKNLKESFQNYQEDFFHIQTFPHIFYLAKIFGFKGQNYIVNNACASGSYGLDLANSLIKSKKSDIAIVVSSDYAHPTEFLWLNKKGFCSNKETILPFSLSGDGTVLGDGASAILLESEEHAFNRTANVKCEYVGGAFQQETWRMTLPNVKENSYSQVIDQVIKDSKVNTIDLIIPHGTGNYLWDKYEMKEIIKSFSGKQQPFISGFKQYIGHTLGASSLLEITILIECLCKNIILPIHYKVRDESSPKFMTKNIIKQKVRQENLKTVMKTVSAYGGFTSASIFKKV